MKKKNQKFSGKKNFKGKKNFSNFKKKDTAPAELMRVSDISLEKKGDKVELSGIVDRVNQTSGPTLFFLNDGTGTLSLKGFDGPGVRAHPEIEEKDYVNTIIRVNEFNGSLEGEIIRIIKLSDAKVKEYKEKIEKIERERAKVDPPEFLVKDKILDKLKERFIDAATEIRLAIIKNRPIIVRHHNDADGYSSGFALEKAIIPLIEKQHGPGPATWEYFTRAPCAAPFYEIDDSIRDTANSLFHAAKHSNHMPLVIIADNGSSPEDLLAISQGKIHGIDFIVVDHHYFEKDVISKEVLVHISPFLVGEDGSQFSAGMLCAEFSRFINPEIENTAQIAAMAGFADRTDNPKALQSYLKLAEKEGYTKSLLGEISQLIDFISKKLRFMEAREYIEVLFGEPRARQKELVKLMTPYINALKEKGLEIAKSGTTTEKLNGITVQFLDVERSFPGFGFYPRPGIAIELLHDDTQYNKKINALISLGVMNSAITIRATDEANFSVHEIISYLNKEVPEAFVTGGGHKNAGTISFIPSKQKEVLDYFRKYLKQRKYSNLS